MRSGDMWFRPIETRIGPDGALYVVDFYNQAVIHNDTRGPQHGPANAAVRPDRDHYFGRIWRVQHKQATKLTLPALNRTDLPGLIRAIETNPNAQIRQTAWRLAQENHGSDARLARIKKPMGSSVLALYERALAAKTPAARTALLDTYVQSNDNWTRSAIAAAATEQASPYVASAFAHERAQALTEFVAARRARRLAGERQPAAGRRRGRRRPGVGTQGASRPCRCPDGGGNDRHGRGHDCRPGEAPRRSGHERGGAADRGEVGQVRRAQRER